MKQELKNWTPPGILPQNELKELAFIWGLAVLCACGFFWSYSSAYRDLFYLRYDGVRVLREGAVMTPFGELLREPMLGFVAAAAAVGIRILQHYLYYSKGSHALYLMRRLPDRWLLHRQCLTIPLLGLLALGLGAAVMAGLAYLVYIHFTPAGTLPIG